MRNLNFPELQRLLASVFGIRDQERDITFFVDLPNAAVPDTAAWRDRRRIAADWFTVLQAHAHELPFEGVTCCVYENVGLNNGDLPAEVSQVDRAPRDQRETNNNRREVKRIPLETVLAKSSIVLSITELSATAPLKILARRLGFRGATLPGFSRAMLPALGLDYAKIHARVLEVKERLDRASSAAIDFVADGETHRLTIDLRYRSAHASGGLMREDGVVANLPSGEAYIVPYEGERKDEPSLTHGLLPVDFDGEIVLFRVENNRAFEVTSTGKQSLVQAKKLREEPAYGNIAELGIGVLGEWGVTAAGSTLLDEKLGLHVAFGRSEHFGGCTSPASFKNSKNVIHIDWVYVPSVQPRVSVSSAALYYVDGSSEVIMTDGKLVI